MTTPNWQMWGFDDIEIDLRDYARKNNLAYDPNRPLSMLPDDAAKNALIAAGGSYEEIAKYMPAHKKTVSGWFRPGRNPVRDTVARNIVPAICEAYVRHNEDDFLTFFFDRSNYIYEGKRPSEAYLQMVQHRVFMLLTTGSKQTPDDCAYILNSQLDDYYREVLRYAAASLHGRELEDASRAALHVLKSHMATTLVSAGGSDALSRAVNDNAWIFNAGDQAGLQGGATDGTVRPEELLHNAANELKAAETSMLLNGMSDGELESLSALADEIRGRRERERIEIARQLHEDGRSSADQDDDAWDH